MAKKSIEQRIQEAPANNQRLNLGDFDLSNGVAGARTKIASFQATTPLAIREESVRLMFVTVEEFTTDGSGTEQTHNLSHDLLPTSNTTDFVLFSDGDRTAAGAVDYAGDSFTYTDAGAAETLHAYYVARDPVQVEIEKSAPSSKGRVAETVYDDVTSILHERNQHKEPPAIDFKGAGPLAPMVPRKWTVDVYAKGPVPFAWNDDGEANSQGTTATNAVLSIPVNRAQVDIADLGQKVKEDIVDA